MYRKEKNSARISQELRGEMPTRPKGAPCGVEVLSWVKG